MAEKKRTKKEQDELAKLIAEQEADMKADGADDGEEDTRKTKEEYIRELKALAKKKTLTYGEIGEHLEAVDMDKDEMEEIYEALMSGGIEIVSEEAPDDYELNEIEEEEEDAVPDDAIRSVCTSKRSARCRS